MNIIHGENQVKSRDLLFEIIERDKSKNKEILKFTGGDVTLTELKQACESTSLFGDDRLIVIELGISKGNGEIIEYLSLNKCENLIIWENGTLKATDLRKFPNAKVREFKLPTRLFEYLDLIGSNSYQTTKILNELLANEDEELIFIMTHKRLRQLVYLSGGEVALNGVERMAPWQVGKLKKQMTLQSTETWKLKYEKCLEFDWNRKMGESALNCGQFLSLII